jgi:hypothetical protein
MSIISPDIARLSKPLSTAEIQSLNDTLEGTSKRQLNVSLIQGLLTACIVGPELATSRIILLSHLAQVILSGLLAEEKGGE